MQGGCGHEAMPRALGPGQTQPTRPRSPPPKNQAPRGDLGVRAKGLANSRTAPVGVRRGRQRGNGTRRRLPRGTGAKEGSFRPPPIDPRGNRECPGTVDGQAAAQNNPPGVDRGRRGPPQTKVLPFALRLRHPCTRRRPGHAAVGLCETRRSRLLAREPPAASTRHGQRRGLARHAAGRQRGQLRRRSSPPHTLALPDAQLRRRLLREDWLSGRLFHQAFVAARCCTHAARLRTNQNALRLWWLWLWLWLWL